jgi:uncharacterized protein YggE
LIIAYKPGLTETGEFRFPIGVPPSLGATGFQNIEQTSSTNLKTIAISGTGTVSVKADQATVSLGVYTENKLASIAIEENANLMAAVIKAIKDKGIPEQNIQTTYYSVSPNYNWEIRQVIGYQVTNMVQIKITDLTKVGSTLDSATGAGANRVDGVSFGLKDETASSMKLQAYSAAINDAKAKLGVITSGLQITASGVQSITETSYYPPIAYRSYTVAESGTKATTPILEGTLSVSVTLNIVWLIA